MIFAMAVIGAITRLTESGLSIMEWAPVTGILPPLGQAEWERLFALYREIPEYQQINRGMDLAEFRQIFWWEYIHRLWGRLIGLVFAVPLVWFWLTGRVQGGLRLHLPVMLALGGLQGLIGWYMVASGLAERTDVSQYRLVFHLGMALAIYGYILWIAFGLLWPRRREVSGDSNGPLRLGLIALLVLVAVTIASGGLVAGTDAGLIYNSFPLMDGKLVPQGYGELTPWYLNGFENLAAIQFNHRLLAVSTVAVSVGLWLWSNRFTLRPAAHAGFVLLFAMAALQLALGVATLLLVVPIWLAALHQAGAIVVLTSALFTLYCLRDGREPAPPR